MKNRIHFVAGGAFGEWNLEEFLGRGGNGEVWKVSKSGKESVALKILKKSEQKSYDRFKSEIFALERIGSATGIIPLLEKNIPKNTPTNIGDDFAWYTMPVAIKFSDYIKDRSIIDLVRDFIDLSSTVEHLHSLNIAHRDIKPANFLFYQGRLCLSDFGLVKYPDREEITPAREDVGAKFTMAPEMRRTAHLADGLPADVYSLAKSLWIALTKIEQGFDGQYTTLTKVLSLSSYFPNIYTTTLDRLLVECTETDPALRPQAGDFKARLQEWLEIIEDFHTQNLEEWTELTQKLFPIGRPKQSTWTSIDAICSVLSEISKVQALNHMFYPEGGGNNITAVSRAAEKGMIALHVGEHLVDILKPKKLTFESFGEDTSWSYFRLEAENIEPSRIDTYFIYDINSERFAEELTEVTAGKYASFKCWEDNEFNNKPLPESARPVSRYLKGSFVFFSTRSPYNLDPTTYDGRHSRMSEFDFREYILRNSKR